MVLQCCLMDQSCLVLMLKWDSKIKPSKLFSFQILNIICAQDDCDIERSEKVDLSKFKKTKIIIKCSLITFLNTSLNFFAVLALQLNFAANLQFLYVQPVTEDSREVFPYFFQLSF